jgi:hypothetical protein
MQIAVLVASGSFLLGYGCLRGYGAARAALQPLVHEGDATRSLVDSTRPLHARTRVRGALRNVVAAIAWLAISMYGMYLLTAGLEAGA